jgi:hypothetical protein
MNTISCGPLSQLENSYATNKFVCIFVCSISHNSVQKFWKVFLSTAPITSQMTIYVYYKSD